MADTGHGATLTLATSGWAGKITNLSIDGEEIPVIDVSHYAHVPVAQVEGGTIDTYDAATTYNVTISGVTVGVTGNTDVNTTASDLRVALNGSANKYFAAITWSGATNNIIGTADTAGEAFSPALTVSGGTGTVTDFSTTTANVTRDRVKIFGTLKEPPRLTAQTLFEPDEPSTTTWPVLDGVAETITVTFPALSGYATAATITGSGALVSWSADMGDDATAMTGELVFQFDGQTGPTFTDYIA